MTSQQPRLVYAYASIGEDATHGLQTGMINIRTINGGAGFNDKDYAITSVSADNTQLTFLTSMPQGTYDHTANSVGGQAALTNFSRDANQHVSHTTGRQRVIPVIEMSSPSNVRLGTRVIEVIDRVKGDLGFPVYVSEALYGNSASDVTFDIPVPVVSKGSTILAATIGKMPEWTRVWKSIPTGSHPLSVTDSYCSPMRWRAETRCRIGTVSRTRVTPPVPYLSL